MVWFEVARQAVPKITLLTSQLNLFWPSTGSPSKRVLQFGGGKVLYERRDIFVVLVDQPLDTRIGRDSFHYLVHAAVVKLWQWLEISYLEAGYGPNSILHGGFSFRARQSAASRLDLDPRLRLQMVPWSCMGIVARWR